MQPTLSKSTKSKPTQHFARGGMIKGPGTGTSDDIDGQVVETKEPIRVSNGERIVSVDQNKLLEDMSREIGHPSLDSMLEAGTGKPVGPTVKYVGKPGGKIVGAAKGKGKKRPVQAASEGGLLGTLKRAVGTSPPETLSEKYARQDAERAAKKPAPAPAPAPVANTAIQAGLDGAGGNSVENRMKAAGAYSLGGIISFGNSSPPQLARLKTRQSAPVATPNADGVSITAGVNAVGSYAEGGLLGTLKRAVGMAPKETMIEKYARQDAERAAKAPPPAQPAAPAATSTPSVQAGLDGAGGNSIETRLKAAGAYANGGVVKGVLNPVDGAIQYDHNANVGLIPPAATVSNESIIGGGGYTPGTIQRSGMGLPGYDPRMEGRTVGVPSLAKGGLIRAAAGGKPPEDAQVKKQQLLDAQKQVMATLDPAWKPEQVSAPGLGPTPAASTAPTPPKPGVFDDTNAVAREVDKDVQGAWKKGDISGAVGKYGRGLLATGAAAIGDIASSGAGLYKPVANTVSNFLTGEGISESAPPKTSPIQQAAAQPKYRPAVDSQAANVDAPAAAAAAPVAATMEDRLQSDAAISGVLGRRSGGDAKVNAGRSINTLAGDSGARDTVNQAWAQRGAGVEAQSDGKGGLILTNAKGPQKLQYVDVNGNPTNNYQATQQYAEGMAQRNKLLADAAKNPSQYDKEVEQARRANEAGTGFETKQARTINNERRDWEAKSKLASRLATPDEKKAALDTLHALGQESTEAQRLDGQAIREAATSRLAEAVQRQNQINHNDTQGLAKEKLKLDQNADSRASSTFAQQQAQLAKLQALHDAYGKAAPADRPGIAEQIRVLQGKEQAARFKTTALQAVKNADGSTSPGMVVTTNEHTGETRVVDPSAHAGGTPPPGHVSALQANPALAAAFDAKYGAGASSTYLTKK